jgi:phosphonate transport system permease protein
VAVAGDALGALRVRADRLDAVRLRARAAILAGWLLGALLVAAAARATLVAVTDWSRITAESLVRSVGRFARVDLGLLPSLARPAVETILMATLGTLLGSAMALPVAWLGAANVTPLGRASYLLARALMTLSRSVHEIVWGLVFVAAAGLGTLAGILAMAVRSIGFISKTVAEAIEDVDPGPVEAMRAVGASRLQVLLFAILPQVVPVLLGNVVFEWDVNIRRSTIMGLVGAGGLGLAMHRQMAAYEYGGVSAVILVVLVLILAGEVVSHHARKALL